MFEGFFCKTGILWIMDKIADKKNRIRAASGGLGFSPWAMARSEEQEAGAGGRWPSCWGGTVNADERQGIGSRWPLSVNGRRGGVPGARTREAEGGAGGLWRG